MALTNSPLVTNSGGGGVAVKFRQFMKSMLPQGGVAGANDCLVKQRVTPSQGVLVSAGGIWMPGTSATIQGDYFDYNDADYDVPATAADGAQTRIDRVIYRVRDPDYVSGTPLNDFEWLTGTAGSGLPPTVPTDAISLAQVARAVNGNTLTNAMITDERVYAVALGGAVRGWKVAGAPTTGTYTTGAFGFDVNGTLWYCTAGGTPGTWIPTSSVKFYKNTALSGLSTTGAISIPAGFSEIRLRGMFTSNQAGSQFVNMQFNSDTAAHYFANWSAVVLPGNSFSGANQNAATAANVGVAVASGSVINSSYFDCSILGCNQSTSYQNFIFRNSRFESGTSATTTHGGGLWAPGSAQLVTSVTIVVTAGLFSTGSWLEITGYA